MKKNVCRTESLCCTLETNTTLYINYPISHHDRNSRNFVIIMIIIWSVLVRLQTCPNAPSYTFREVSGLVSCLMGEEATTKE